MPLVTAPALARMLPISVKIIARLRNRGAIPYYKADKKYLYDPAEVREAIRHAAAEAFDATETKATIEEVG